MTDKENVDLQSIAKLYTDSLIIHGAAAQGVGWRDTQTHLLRFDKLTAVVQSDGTPISINDLGCGYGALYEYFRLRGQAVTAYRGYDISEKMLDEARSRISTPEVTFINAAKLTEPADYSFASGIFNVRLQTTEEQWRSYILEVLANMNATSTKGFAFNLLTSYVDWHEAHLYYGDPGFFFDYCKRNFSRHISLLHDYPLWEWTITVRK